MQILFCGINFNLFLNFYWNFTHKNGRSQIRQKIFKIKNFFSWLFSTLKSQCRGRIWTSGAKLGKAGKGIRPKMLVWQTNLVSHNAYIHAHINVTMYDDYNTQVFTHYAVRFRSHARSRERAFTQMACYILRGIEWVLSDDEKREVSVSEQTTAAMFARVW